MRSIIVIILFVLISLRAGAQQPPDTSIFAYPIAMDEVVVKAARGGWDVQAFMRRVRTDTTFFKAFRSLRVVSYSAVNDIKVYGKKGNVIASLFSKTRQTVSGGCRTMQVLEEQTTGDFYKRNKEYNYYTAELYAYLFFTTGKVCGDNDIVGTNVQRGKGQIEKSKYQLRQLVFNPGAKISGVPFMGDKAAIFEPDQAKRYDFKLTSETYDGEECYVFTATPKKGEEDNVVYNNLATWFRKSDYAIVARDYSLSYNTMLYDFNVKMKVRTRQIGNRLLPTRIDYDGNWDVAAKPRERVRFTTLFTY